MKFEDTPVKYQLDYYHCIEGCTKLLQRKQGGQLRSIKDHWLTADGRIIYVAKDYNGSTPKRPHIFAQEIKPHTFTYTNGKSVKRVVLWDEKKRHPLADIMGPSTELAKRSSLKEYF